MRSALWSRRKLHPALPDALSAETSSLIGSHEHRIGAVVEGPHRGTANGERQVAVTAGGVRAVVRARLVEDTQPGHMLSSDVFRLYFASHASYVSPAVIG